MSKKYQVDANKLLYAAISISVGLLALIIILKGILNIDITNNIIKVFNFIINIIPDLYKGINISIDYLNTWYIAYGLGFAMVFIFAFLLGFEKINLNVGMPIIITFGLIAIYPFIRAIFEGIFSFIDAFYNAIKLPTFDLSTAYTKLFEPITKMYEEFVKNIKKYTDIPKNMEKLKSDSISNLPLFLFIIFISIVIYYADKDPDTLSTNAYKYAFLLFIPLLLFMWYNMTIKSSEYTFISMFAFCIIAAIGLYVWMSMNKSSLYVWSVFSTYLLIPIIVLVGFAIFYKIILKNINTLTGINRFIVDFIFFIPCLLLDFLEYIKGQFNLTPNVVYILLFIEILLILLFLYLPDVITSAIQKNSKVLRSEPLFLNKENLIGTSSIGLMVKPSLDLTDRYRTNYSISFWTIINTHDNTNVTENTNTIFKYGKNNSYKPRVSYKVEGKTGDNFIFQFSTSSDYIYKMALPSQKWHNFVFNYNNSRVDLFVNGKLEKTYEFADDADRNDLPTYSSTDEIKVGNDNGLDGAICNIQYYSVPLTNSDIANLYNLYIVKNPPV